MDLNKQTNTHTRTQFLRAPLATVALRGGGAGGAQLPPPQLGGFRGTKPPPGTPWGPSIHCVVLRQWRSALCSVTNFPATRTRPPQLLVRWVEGILMLRLWG